MNTRKHTVFTSKFCYFRCGTSDEVEMERHHIFPVLVPISRPCHFFCRTRGVRWVTEHDIISPLTSHSASAKKSWVVSSPPPDRHYSTHNFFIVYDVAPLLIFFGGGKWIRRNMSKLLHHFYCFGGQRTKRHHIHPMSCFILAFRNGWRGV
jgi:hypothetical protein